MGRFGDSGCLVFTVIDNVRHDHLSTVRFFLPLMVGSLRLRWIWQTSVSVALHKRVATVATVRKHAEALTKLVSRPCQTEVECSQASKSSVQHKMAYFGTIQVGVLSAFVCHLVLVLAGRKPSTGASSVWSFVSVMSIKP